MLKLWETPSLVTKLLCECKACCEGIWTFVLNDFGVHGRGMVWLAYTIEGCKSDCATKDIGLHNYVIKIHSFGP